MTQNHLMIAINWFGPYKDLDEARNCARHDYSHGLYLVIGKRRSERTKKLQYVGIGKAIHTRLNEGHHKISLVEREREIWLGEIMTAEPPGRRRKATRATLDFAEWLHARFLQLPLNEKKTKALPGRSVTVLNRWFCLNYETPKRRPHKDWPDLIDYPDFDLPARAVWFGLRQRRFFAPDYAA